MHVTGVFNVSAGATLIANTWTTRTLNTTVTNEISGASLSGSTITGLTAGTYIIQVKTSMFNIGAGFKGVSRVSHSAGTLEGIAVQAVAAAGATSTVDGKFTLASTGSLTIQSYLSVTSDECVLFSGPGSIVATDVMLWKTS